MVVFSKLKTTKQELLQESLLVSAMNNTLNILRGNNVVKVTGVVISLPMYLIKQGILFQLLVYLQTFAYVFAL